MSVMSMARRVPDVAAWGWRNLLDLRVRDAGRDRRYVRVYTGRAVSSPASGEISLTFANSHNSWTTEVRLTPTEALRVAESLSQAARKVLEGEA